MKKLIFSLLFLAGVLNADEVQLADGSLLKGKIVQVFEGSLVFKSDALGKINIKLANVTSY
ncbi:MAG: hypothetical protein NE327_01290, partial [Lentisphaeraceae bacterium]|nr:hypothetical protein [Lentisphaeraceae bacterium]